MTEPFMVDWDEKRHEPKFQVRDTVKAFGVEGRVTDKSRAIHGKDALLKVEFDNGEVLLFSEDGKFPIWATEPSLVLVSRLARRHLEFKVLWAWNYDNTTKVSMVVVKEQTHRNHNFSMDGFDFVASNDIRLMSADFPDSMSDSPFPNNTNRIWVRGMEKEHDNRPFLFYGDIDRLFKAQDEYNETNGVEFRKCHDGDC